MTATKVALELKCSYQNARNRLTKIGYDGLKKARKKCGVLLLSWWHRIARRATDREIPVTVTIEQVAAKFENQRRVCNLTGQPLTMPEAEWEAFTKRVNASLDRIDSTKGYLPDNIQWVLKEIQDMKGVLSQDRFIELCCMVADHHRRKQADIR